jgi:hypothetical protein
MIGARLAGYEPRMMDGQRTERPFRCGFQAAGKPYREYVAHIQQCKHSECRNRWENNQALTAEILAKYGGKLDRNEHQAASSTHAGAHLPSAATSTGSHRHPTRSY